MKIAGSSRKDGMTLYGPHYKVSVTVPEPGAEPIIEVKEHASGEAITKTKDIPVLRGISSLVLNNPEIAAMLGLQLATEIVDRKENGNKPLRVLLTAANLGLTGWMLYKTAGNVKELRKFHGAEHKVIGAQEQNLPNDVEHVKTVTRISDRCGTNFAGFYLPAQLITALLPLPSDTLKALLAMGIAYEGFKLDREKYGKYTEPFYKLGAKAQEYITTAEPDEEHLNAAVAAMEALLKAEAAVTEPSFENTPAPESSAAEPAV